jgi:hypothetical protein
MQKHSTLTHTGNYSNAYNPNTSRDLGFVGKIGGSVINSFGDTGLCPPGQTCPPIAANSAGLSLSPTSYKDTPDSSKPSQFCKYFSDEPADKWGMGITNVVPVSTTTGVIFTLPNYRGPGTPFGGSIVGAGTGVVAIDSSTGAPTCLRTSHYIWDGPTEPWYGDHSAFLDASGQYVYAMGGSNVTNSGGSYLWLARVPVGQTFNTSAYQYWNGFVYGNARIKALQQYSLIDTSSKSVQDGGQGQVKYNRYLGKFVYVYTLSSDLSTEVRMRTATQPQGPWSDPITIADSKNNCAGLTYGVVYDDNWYANDQSVVIRYTCSTAYQQSVKVTFTN